MTRLHGLFPGTISLASTNWCWILDGRNIRKVPGAALCSLALGEFCRGADDQVSMTGKSAGSSIFQIAQQMRCPRLYVGANGFEKLVGNLFLFQRGGKPVGLGPDPHC